MGVACKGRLMGGWGMKQWILSYPNVPMSQAYSHCYNEPVPNVALRSPDGLSNVLWVAAGWPEVRSLLLLDLPVL